MLQNHGAIFALDTDVDLTDVQASPLQIKVHNWGLLSGGDYACYGSGNLDFLCNRGELRGDVRMGAGNDVTDNRPGTIDVYWNGEADDDVYHDALDTHVLGGIYGGQGFDRLFGGVAGQLRYDVGSAQVQGDTKGNGIVDFGIALIKRPPVLAATDFLL